MLIELCLCCVLLIDQLLLAVLFVRQCHAVSDACRFMALLCLLQSLEISFRGIDIILLQWLLQLYDGRVDLLYTLVVSINSLPPCIVQVLVVLPIIRHFHSIERSLLFRGYAHIQRVGCIGEVILDLFSGYFRQAKINELAPEGHKRCITGHRASHVGDEIAPEGGRYKIGKRRYILLQLPIGVVEVRPVECDQIIVL